MNEQPKKVITEEKKKKDVSHASIAVDHASYSKKTSAPRVAVIIFFCFVASFFGSWLFLQTGIVNSNNLHTQDASREKIVMREGEVIADVAKKVSPSVVSVVTQSVSRSALYRPSAGAGTGVIISNDGYILTNKHVVGNATKVSIVTHDGTAYNDVTVIGKDPSNDLAFLKVNKVSNLTPAALGDSSQVNIGQKVVTIGNALGEYQNSVTSGIISGKGRPVVAQDGNSDEQLDNLFQTDAAINPGNSGGPLLNLNGEVIGINTAVAQNAEGIGFAIPINAAKGLIKSVIASGHVEKSYLGVRYLNLTPQLAERLKVQPRQGAYVGSLSDESEVAVVAGSPADKAGIQDRDVITKVNNVAINQENGLALLLAQYTPGDKVTLTIVRGGAEKTINVTLGRYEQ